MKNEDLKNLLTNFSKLNNLSGDEFVIAFNRNKEKIVEKVKSLEDIKAPTEEFNELIRKGGVVHLKFAKKDENNNPMFEEIKLPDGRSGQRPIVLEDKIEEYSKTLIDLEKDNKGILEEQANKDLEYTKEIVKPVGLRFHKIGKTDVPKNITIEQFDTISFMVNL